MSNAQRIHDATAFAMIEPGRSPYSYDEVLTEVAIEMGLPLLFTLDAGDMSLTQDGRTIDPGDYSGQVVVVVGNTEDTEFGEAEPLWWVRASDGTVFAAWKSEVGL